MFDLVFTLLLLIVAIIWITIFAMKVRDHRRDTLERWEHGDSVVLRKLGHFLTRRKSDD